MAFLRLVLKLSLHGCYLKQRGMWYGGTEEHLPRSLASMCDHVFKHSRRRTSIPFGLQFCNDPVSLLQQILEENKDLQNELVGFSRNNCFFPQNVPYLGLSPSHLVFIGPLCPANHPFQPLVKVSEYAALILPLS